jgi:hypothetical protein
VKSDKQAPGLSIRELERIRNENLVGILQALKTGHDGEGWGAGKLLASSSGDFSPTGRWPLQSDGPLPGRAPAPGVGAS